MDFHFRQNNDSHTREWLLAIGQSVAETQGQANASGDAHAKSAGKITALFSKLISADDAQPARLFDVVRKQWLNTYKLLDRDLLKKLSQGEPLAKSDLRFATLKKVREEANYMRSGYLLFADNHQPPSDFHKFVKTFGEFKDAVSHGLPQVAAEKAAWLNAFVRDHEAVLTACDMKAASRESLYMHVAKRLHQANTLMSKSVMPIDDFHTIKKNFRELCFLFRSLSQDADSSSTHRTRYTQAAEELWKINLALAEIHDPAAASVLGGAPADETTSLEFPQKVRESILATLGSLISS